MSSGPVITVDSVSKRFRLYHERNQSLKASVIRGRRARYEEFWALKDVSFEVPEGSTFGLIGENGSGKSTLLKCIAKILRPDGGTISTRGKLSALLELGAGFHQELTGRDNVYLNGAILGLTKRQLDARFDEIVAFAGIEQFIDTPVKNYSSGMYVRLGFSVAINVDPDVLLVDEVLAVGDAEFQRKCTEKIAEFHKQGKTIVLVSHTLPTVRALCDEVALLDHGALVDIGTPGHIIDHYLADAFSDATNESGLIRWGSGEVRVDRVELLDALGTPHPRGTPVTRSRSASTTTRARPYATRSSESRSTRSVVRRSAVRTCGTPAWYASAWKAAGTSTTGSRGCCSCRAPTTWSPRSTTSVARIPTTTCRTRCGSRSRPAIRTRRTASSPSAGSGRVTPCA